MRLKRCEHCNHLYAPQVLGMMAKLCRPCAMDCDLSYIKVYKFLREEQFNHQRELSVADAEFIAEGSKVPAIFVKILYEEGRFNPKNDPTAPPRCKTCARELKATERDYCKNCMESLSRAIQETRQQIVLSNPGEAKEERPQAATPQSRSAQPADKNHRYGLGR